MPHNTSSVVIKGHWKNEGLKGFKMMEVRADRNRGIGTSSAIIGRYVSNEITPSVEVAAKITDALDVSTDYLAGNTNQLLEKKYCKADH